MKIKNLILLILLFIVSNSAFSATWKMKDTTIRECSGTHTDSDALFGGLYGSNEDFTFSICPGTGATIYYTFSALQLEVGNDTIWFYNGPNTSSPLLAAYTGAPSPLPGMITANSGCLTIRFKSDGSLQLPGWVATWTTNPPPVIPPILGIRAVNPPTCGATFFVIEFDKNVQCDSIVNSSITFSGFNPPTVTSIVKFGCGTIDSSKFARINLSTPFIYNCEYIMTMNIKIPDVCDSVYNFVLKDTFDFTNCDLVANMSNDSTICYGSCASVEVLSTASCNTYSYSWNNGLPNSAGPHTVCPTTSTTYIVTVTESSSGKTYTDSIRVTVRDTVNTNLDISSQSSLAPRCNANNFIVKFDRPINCNLIDSGVFTLTGANGSVYTNVTKIPLNCIGNFMDSAFVRFNPRFTYNCDYYVTFNLNYIDSCGGPISIIARDTFAITDCPFAPVFTYNDTVCIGSCTQVTTPATCYLATYVWSNGLPNNIGPHNICPTGDTTFHVLVTEIGSGLTFRDTINIKVINPTINPVSPLCNYDSPLNLSAITSGGTWSGTGITNTTLGTFNPSNAGGGNHIITYTLAGCSDTILITVTAPNAGVNRNICNSGIPINLPNGTPVGGTWTGLHVNSTLNTFTPTVYGTFYPKYTVNGCVDSIRVRVDTIAFTYKTDTLCSSSPAVYIPFSPLGGTWTGTGIISASSGIFDPAVANNGSNKVQYFYKGCRDTVNMVVVSVNAGNDTNSCPLQPPFAVATAIPSSGTWSGIGITNATTGMYNPATIGGNGIDTLIYTFQGCTDTMLMNVVQTNINIDTFYFCPTQDSVLLNTMSGLTTNPNYGVWSGTGVNNYGTNYYVYPKILGYGFHTIFYEKNTCKDSVTLVIYPDSLSYRDSTLCSTHPPFKLDSSKNMPGAVWKGNGITDSITGMFDPSLATIGTNIITYKTKGSGCDKIIRMHVYQFVAANITLADTLCFKNQSIPIPVVPSGGNWSGTGVYNKTVGTINSATAGIGNHQIIYTFGVGACLTTDTKTIFVRDPLQAILSTLNDTLCIGNSTTLTAGWNGGKSPYTFTWNHTSSTNSTQNILPTSTQDYIVTISDGCSDPDSDTVTVTVLSINPTLLSSTAVCYGETGFTTFDIAQKSIYNFNWTKPVSSADTVFGVGKDTNFLTITNSFGCSIDTFIVINGYDFLKADFDISPNIYPKCLSSNSKKLIVTDKSNGVVSGSWDFGDGTVLPYNSANSTEENVYANGGNYTVQLIVKNNGPCFDTLDYEICVSDQLFFIADIFSPNGDGMNDILYVRSSEAKELEFLVFDRWGKVVFESDDVAKGWDGTHQGTDMEEGIYFFSATIKLETGEIILEKGDVTLKR